jgi:hypothetical protein
MSQFYSFPPQPFSKLFFVRYSGLIALIAISLFVIIWITGTFFRLWLSPFFIGIVAFLVLFNSVFAIYLFRFIKRTNPEGRLEIAENSLIWISETESKSIEIKNIEKIILHRKFMRLSRNDYHYVEFSFSLKEGVEHSFILSGLSTEGVSGFAVEKSISAFARNNGIPIHLDGFN